MSAILAQARTRLAKERARLSAPRAARPPAEVTWRPTPTRGENNFTAVTGALVMTKAWDLSPVDPWAFDPTQPPGPVARPVNTVPPSIVPLGSKSANSWPGPPEPVRQRPDLRPSVEPRRTPIAGATNPGYTLVEADVGAVIGFTVTGIKAVGSVSADATPVKP